MSPVNTVVVRKRYTIYASPSSTPQAHLYDKIAGRVLRKPLHQDDYTLHDWVHLCDYLNDRITGYPVPSALIPLRSQHNEDRRRAGGDFPKPINTGRLRANVGRGNTERGRVTRRKGGTPRK